MKEGSVGHYIDKNGEHHSTEGERARELKLCTQEIGRCTGIIKAQQKEIARLKEFEWKYKELCK